MNKDLFKILKELQQIKPDPNYSRQSRLLIVGLREKLDITAKSLFLNFFSVRFKMAIGTALTLILMISGTIYYINQLNQQKLVAKANEINSSIQIKLDEFKYILENKPQVDSTTISNVQTLLEKANNELKEASTLNNLEEALQKIKSAQEIFLQINSALKQ